MLSSAARMKAYCFAEMPIIGSSLNRRRFISFSSTSATDSTSNAENPDNKVKGDAAS
jgi:hypothetical protein